jgi:DNA-binding NarL/FixJ family response regulator
VVLRILFFNLGVYLATLMKNEKSHLVFVAHSNKHYVLGLTIGFSQNGYSILKQTKSGTEALQYILQHQPKIAIIELDLPLLSAFDIIKMAKSKGIATKFVVVFPTKQLPLFNPLTFVKINGVYYCNSSVKEVCKVLGQLFDSSKHWILNLVTKKMKRDFANEKIKAIQSLSNDELAELLNLHESQQDELSKETQKELEIGRNKKLASIAVKLNLNNSAQYLKEWSTQNYTMLKAFSIGTIQHHVK